MTGVPLEADSSTLDDVFGSARTFRLVAVTYRVRGGKRSCFGADSKDVCAGGSAFTTLRDVAGSLWRLRLLPKTPSAKIRTMVQTMPPLFTRRLMDRS
ncbi:MAG: hypothetical protein BGO81_10805 [Devosia sp. 66-22]|nr:MAG: hypothetical protein BGO81_10805 [Devosia sp. 66-22]